ncbi:hypothetical protein MRB53_005891 [Persea americana]|uniref:Uncharacterized protein n=1 Tax=Persea americana TaxID=3435 RepID=A0ACC2MFH5_PERAE|nr:hypothetical protein MRB53_005891 [Persea americana]
MVSAINSVVRWHRLRAIRAKELDGASTLGLFSGGPSSLEVSAWRCRTPVLGGEVGAGVDALAAAEDVHVGAEAGATPVDKGARGAWPPITRASRSATSTGGRRLYISSSSSKLEES